ncbi:hypothetical protein [Microvirga sesbaniae]|uniref:hypothetical protein n=1 Tax=Microvirga sesbaniae TaxID=681392 RepID=UPI0021C813BB|nr:hypothetical protein [Microvirga sp. HBU67692]
MSAVSVYSTPELIAEYAKPKQDIFGNLIQVRATVRSFNLATLLNDGRVYGMDTRITASNRVDIIEGKEVATRAIVHEGCPRYTIRISRECYGAEGVDTYDVCYGTGHLVYPPLNGTPKSLGGVTFGVVALSPA